MLDSSTKYLKAHSPEGSVSASTLFDEVVFCANVTYSSGSFKSGLSLLFAPCSLPLLSFGLCRLDDERDRRGRSSGAEDTASARTSMG